MTVRTRVAPSPTGDPHVGTAYIALFNYVFAASQGGEFILRFEDTDAARSRSDSEQKIFTALDWLGIPWSEGPDRGGQFGPYRQSERLATYRQYADQLIEQGSAFRCFCTAERLDEMRQAQRAAGQTTGYDGHCLQLSAAEAEARIDAGEPHVVRMKVPREGTCRFNDALRGEIEVPWSQVDMQVLLKADGFPTYHLAVVVDDHLMQITHVLRGEEWINSVPKHQLLYSYFGWDMPVHAHLPLLRNPDSSKLSKRKNPTSITYYRDIGVLPEALLNYLGRMGWSMPDEQEVFSLKEMIQAFDLQRVSLGGPVFDLEKLNWLNGEYVRGLSKAEFGQRVQGWLLNEARLAPLIDLVQARTTRLDQLAGQLDYLLGDRVSLEKTQFEALRLDLSEQIKVLDHCLRAFDDVQDWQRDNLEQLCKQLAEFVDHKLRDFLQPLFVAVSGRLVALPLFDAMAYLGSDVTRVRIRSALEVLGRSKKMMQKLEKSYRGFEPGEG